MWWQEGEEENIQAVLPLCKLKDERSFVGPDVRADWKAT